MTTPPMTEQQSSNTATDPEAVPMGLNPQSLNENDPPEHSGWAQLEASIASLEDILTAPREGADWVGNLQAVAKGVQVALKEHQELVDGEGGSLDDIAMRQPSLIPRVDEQRHEHEGLSKRAARLDTVLQRAMEFESSDMERLCLEARILHDTIKLHMMLENELLNEAYRVVEGGGD